MREVYIPSVRELLDTAVEKFGDRTFIKYIKNGETVEKSYRDIRRDSLAVCRYLRSISGTQKHIAVAGKTSYLYLVYLIGILISGNIAIPFAPEISVKEAVSLFSEADIDMLMYEEEFSERAEEIFSACPSIKYNLNISGESNFEKIAKNFSAKSPLAFLSEFNINKDACIAMIFTSGTTGKRKGVMLSTNSLVGNVMYTDYCSALGEGEVSLSVLPMYHVYCFSGDCIRNLKDGVTVCLNGDLRNLPKNILLFEPTVMRAVPMIVQSLVQKANRLADRNPDMSPEEIKKEVFGGNLKWIISGGAYLDSVLIAECEKYGIILRQGYGMTEAGCRISVPDENVSLESVGRVIDICDVRTSNGEIQVKTPSVMMGYYKNPRETEKMFTKDGWLRTGDLGYVTEDRQLFITGRLKNLIILSGGENVSPEAIEKKFADVPEVSEIVVFAENDHIKAEIYPDYEYLQTENEQEIRPILEEKIKTMNSSAKASHVISDFIIRNKPFERTGNGKIKRKAIKVS